jgi:hypothetical protein
VKGSFQDPQQRDTETDTTDKRRSKAKMTQPTEHRAVGGIKTLAFVLQAALVATILLMAAKPAHASTTFTVSVSGDAADANLNDTSCDTTLSILSSPCTLRAAVQEANDTPGADTINFNIPGNAAYKTISPDSGLPAINDEVTIDGYTQPGGSPNALAEGNDAVLKVELNGTDSGNSPGLDVSADTVIRGLVINRFKSAGVLISDEGDGSRIEGNFIGTDPSGMADLGNGGPGVSISSASEVTVGGGSPDARNLISGNDRNGVNISGYGTQNLVQGNYIGTTRAGAGALGNSYEGVYIAGVSDNIVGGVTKGAANTIAFNGGDGVYILRNSIFSNAGLGIVFHSRTANDPGDADIGPNERQNYPVLSSARTSANQTTIRGRLNSNPNETYTLQFFSNPPGTNEGKKFIGQMSVTTGADNRVSFTFRPAKKVGVGRAITATATDVDANTSEFSDPRTVAQ